VNIVSEFDWVTSDTGSLSNDGQGVLLDDRALMDEVDNAGFIVLDVSDLSLEDSLVSSDEGQDLFLVLFGSGLDSDGVFLDLSLDDLDDVLSLGHKSGSSLLNSCLVTGLDDRVVLDVMGSVDSLARLDDSDGSSLVFLNGSDLSVHNVSEVSDLLSGFWGTRLLKFDDVLGGSSDDSNSLLSQRVEGLPVLSSAASDLFVVISLSHLESVELGDDLSDLHSVVSSSSDLSVVLVDFVRASLVLNLHLDSALIGSAHSHLVHVHVVLLLKSVDLLSEDGDLLVGDLNQLFIGDNSGLAGSGVGLGNDDSLVLDNLSLSLVDDHGLDLNLLLKGSDLLSDLNLLLRMGLKLLLELGDLDLVGLDNDDVLMGLSS
jgi:hypothetical protein